jgi:hypothetical protein
MSQIDRADRVFLFLNIAFLMVVAFAPFPTRLIAEHIRGEGARAAALLYGITLVVMALLAHRDHQPDHWRDPVGGDRGPLPRGELAVRPE